MYLKIILQDIKKNKMLTLTVAGLILVASTLISLAILLFVHLSGSIDSLMTAAGSPHFLQMHSGSIDRERLYTFAANTPAVESFQLSEFLNIESSQIRNKEKSLIGSAEDHGVVAQNPHFDLLLDSKNQIIHPQSGEIYVPLEYFKNGFAQVGDRLLIGNSVFVVQGFLRDSQMNSSLSSSKRWLIHADDLSKLQTLGSLEYLIEFRLKDLSMLNNFTSAYTSAGLEANGPTVTYPLFRIINAISDGMIIAVFLLLCFGVVLISFLSIRFSLLAKVEQEIKEIGVLKAIGIGNHELTRLYLAKYFFLGIVSCILGYLLSLLLQKPLLHNIQLSFGQSSSATHANLAALLGVGLIFASILFFVSMVLQSVRKVSPLQALRAAELSHPKKTLPQLQGMILMQDLASFLAIQDIRLRPKLYRSLTLIWILSLFIMLLPLYLYSTVSSPHFINYMGIGNADIRVDIQQTENILEKVQALSQSLSLDHRVKSSEVFISKQFDIWEQGKIQKLKIELGDGQIFPIHYSAGTCPTSLNEIALSYLQAEDLNKQVGDQITLLIGDQKKVMTISGIYSDITYGGKTAKAMFFENDLPILWATIYLNLQAGTAIDNFTQQYQVQFPFAKIGTSANYIYQLYGPNIRSLKNTAILALLLGLGINGLTSVLFFKMLLVKDRRSISILKAIGFSNSKIRRQYFFRCFYLSGPAIVIGFLLVNAIGPKLSGLFLDRLGIANFRFLPPPIIAMLAYPLGFIAIASLFTYFASRSLYKIQVFDHIKE